MGVLRFSCIVFTLLFQYATPDRQPICSIPTESCGPVPPVLPESFTMKATKVDIGKSFTWIEEYFDTNNERAKVVLLQDGNEFNLIFDFGTQEVATYVNLRPGGSASVDQPLADIRCQVSRIADSSLKDAMRYRNRYGNSDQARMYSSNHVLNYGGPHLFAYLADGNSTDSARGLPTYAFKGCVFDQDDDRTMESTYRWIETNKVATASGEEKMPVKIENKGKIFVPKSEKVLTEGYKEFNEVYDIVWFDGNTEFPDSIFQVPPRIQCQFPERKSEKIPNIPDFFSTRLEVMSMKEDWQGRTGQVTYDWYEEIWYDKGEGLVRLDFVPTDALGKEAKDALGAVPISAVYDFKTGVVHYTEKVFGKCVVKKILGNDVLVSKLSRNLQSPDLAEPKELFGLDTPAITYKGKYTVRDVNTKAWAGLHNRTNTDGSLTEVYTEFYVTDGEWHADYDDEEYFDIPIRDTSIVYTILDGQNAKTITEVNFFKFKTTQPHLSFYDIAGCLSSYDRKFFYFELPGDKRDEISHHHEAFLDALRQAITSVANVGTPIRVQELEALFVTTKGVHGYQVSFSLLEVPSLTADVSLRDKGVDLTTAANNLVASINGQGTLLSVTFQYMKKEIKVTATRGSLKEMKAMGETFVNMYSPSFPGSEQNNFPKETVPVMTSFVGQQIMYAPVNEKKPSGYTSGSLAGLAIGMLLIGAVAGIAAMVFYNKRKVQRETDRIALS